MLLAENQLSALVAVLEKGSFERAARHLHVTASAVSQRIKQLEERVGTTLIVRGTPCQPTTVGEAVYRYALQVSLLEQDLLQEIAPEESSVTASRMLSLAVNADSLATWLLPALDELSGSLGVRFDIRVSDEERTTEWLRSGSVLGAVTSEARVVQGCQLQALGQMRYLATASPDFVRQRLGREKRHWGRAPALCFSGDDRLTERFLALYAEADLPSLPRHHLPSPQAIVDACQHGLGWAMNPEPLVKDALESGVLVELLPGASVDVPLHWQQWSLSSPTLNALTETLVRHARDTLQPPNAARSGR